MRMNARSQRTSTFLLLANCGLTGLGCALFGCDESVDPFVESERYFSVYGTLDMNADTQWVRVVPIDTTIFVGGDDAVDAQVSSTDASTGIRTEWTDSLFVFRDGSLGHVFFAPVRVQAGHSYRLEFSKSDGRTAFAETTMPGIPSASVGEIRRIILSNGGVEIILPITWMGIDKPPAEVQTWYRFSSSGRSNFRDFRFEYPTADFDDEPGWKIVARLSTDRQTIIEQILPNDFFFLGMGMRVVVLDEKFVPPGGVFDPDVLSRPGSFSNVENGFGFIGSIGRFDVRWVVDPQTARDLGYVLPKQ